MTEKETQIREELSFITKELSRITGESQGKFYSIVRRAGIIDKYGFRFCLDVLCRMNAGYSFRYCFGVIKSEYIKSGKFENKFLDSLAENF